MKIDRLIRTKRKTIALIVELDGSLTVRAPLRVSNRCILELVEQKAGWIKSKQELAVKTLPVTHAKAYAEGETFWYLGKAFSLEITAKIAPALQLDGRFVMARAALPQAGSIFTRWYREQAKQVIDERVRWYAEKDGFSYKQIKITSARSRWGSCSSKGVLCFTWRVVMAPVEEIDYVVVHELVHLLVKNHSKAFWAKVAAILPDYKERRKRLRQRGELLSLEF